MVTSGDGTITISLDSSLGLGIATQNNLGTVKVPLSGGLEIDNQGNLIIASIASASSGISDFATDVNLEVVKSIDLDDSGRVMEITRKSIAIKDGVTLIEDALGNVILQSDGLAVAMSIVFGG